MGRDDGVNPRMYGTYGMYGMSMDELLVQRQGSGMMVNKRDEVR